MLKGFSKVEDFINNNERLSGVLGNKPEPVKKETNSLLIFLAAIGALTIAFSLGYSVYRLLFPDDFEDSEDYDESFQSVDEAED